MSGMAAVLAHEIKNPLAGIRGAAQLLDRRIGEKDRALTGLITREVDRIAKLIDQMQSLSRRSQEPAVECNLHEAVRHAQAILAAGLEGGDPEARRTVDQFVTWLARVAGDAVMAMQAKGGLYLAGGIAPALNNVAFLVLAKDNAFNLPPTPAGDIQSIHDFLFNTIERVIAAVFPKTDSDPTAQAARAAKPAPRGKPPPAGGGGAKPDGDDEGGGKGDAGSKIEAMKSAGIRVSPNPAALGTTLKELLQGH